MAKIINVSEKADFKIEDGVTPLLAIGQRCISTT